MEENTNKPKDEKNDEQKSYEWAAKPQTVVQQEKRLDELNHKIEALYDIVKDTTYLLDILKNANIPADSPLGALIKLMLDRVESIDEKVKNVGMDKIISKTWLEIEMVRKVLRLNGKNVEQLANKVNVLEAEARGSQKIYEELVKKNEKLTEQLQAAQIGEILEDETPASTAAGVDIAKEEAAKKSIVKHMEKTKKQESEKPEIPVLKKGQTIRFDDGPGEKIAEINGTDICKNIVLMINELNPENPLELGKIIKSYKPHIKYTTLDTYVRGYLKYLKLNWPLPSKAFKKIDWAMKNEAPLSDQEPREKTKAKSTKETGQKKEKPIEETLAKKKEWEDEIITDSEAAQIVVTYDGKVTKRRLGMLLNTILLNGNNVPRKELPDLMVLNVTDVVRHARYAQKKKLISLRKGNYRLTDGGKYMCIHIRDKYNLDVPPPEVEGRTVQKQEKKTGKKYKRKAGMHRLGNKLALKIVKKYETALYRERYEDAVYIVFTEGPIKEADIIEKLSEMEGRSLSRNTVYAHLRYACERRDMKIADGLYRALPNAKRVVEKIQIKKAKAEKPSPPQSTETVEERARRETKKSYGIDIDDEKYQKLKNTLDSAFGYKKSIKEFGNTKSWTNWEAGAYLRYGVKIGEIIPVGKAEKPDGTTRYALKKNEEKLPRERKEIHIKSKGTIRDKNNKEEGARESKNYSIFQKKSEK